LWRFTIDGSPTRELKALQELNTPKNEKKVLTRMNKEYPTFSIQISYKQIPSHTLSHRKKLPNTHTHTHYLPTIET